MAAIASLVVVLAGALVRLSTEPKEESPPTAPVNSPDKFLRVLVALCAVVFTFIGIRYCFNFYRASTEANLAYTIISAIQAGQVPNEVDRRAFCLWRNDGWNWPTGWTRTTATYICCKAAPIVCRTKKFD